MVGFFIVSYNIFIFVYLIHVKLIANKNSNFPLVQADRVFGLATTTRHVYDIAAQHHVCVCI